MKKIKLKYLCLAVLCILCLVSGVLALHYGNVPSYGVTALENLGRFVQYLFLSVLTGVITIVYVLVLVFWKRKKKKASGAGTDPERERKE